MEAFLENLKPSAENPWKLNCWSENLLLSSSRAFSLSTPMGNRNYFCFFIGVDNKKALELDNKAYFLILSSIFKDFQHQVLDFLLKKKKVKVVGKNHYYSTNFPSINLNFHCWWRWWDWIQAIFLNIFYLGRNWVYGACFSIETATHKLSLN